MNGKASGSRSLGSNERARRISPEEKRALPYRGVFSWAFFPLLVLFPAPIFFWRKFVAGNIMESRETGAWRRAIYFISHPRTIGLCYLVVTGWLVGFAWLAMTMNADVPEWAPLLSQVYHYLNWAWVIVLFLTLLLLAVDVSRAGIWMVLLSVTSAVLGLAVIELWARVDLIATIVPMLGKIDFRLGLGFPLLTSLVGGLLGAGSIYWARYENMWRVPVRGAYLEHIVSSDKDEGFGLEEKTISFASPCVLKRFLLFGLGALLIIDTRDNTVIERIDGVFHAREIAILIRSRTAISDTRIVRDYEGDEYV